jgi:hypothetical protein
MIKSRLNELATYGWCGQLVENSHHRNTEQWKSIYELADNGESISEIVFCGFTWSQTPQGQEYWEGIREETF